MKIIDTLLSLFNLTRKTITSKEADVLAKTISVVSSAIDSVNKSNKVDPDQFVHRGASKNIIISVELDRPTIAASDREPITSFIKISGINIDDAKAAIAGKSLNWSTFPKVVRDSLEFTGSASMPWDSFKNFIK